MRTPKTGRFSEPIRFNADEKMREELMELSRDEHQTVSGLCRQFVYDGIMSRKRSREAAA